MKFKTMRMKNFMRYRGENEISFSCDPVRNVTVVLGDNTSGKTTIAQAFRWGLYGALLQQRTKGGEEYLLLNQDVLLGMDADSRAEVAVELVAVDGERTYTIRREVWYARQFPKVAVREYQKKVSLYLSDREADRACTQVDAAKVEEVINELFPRDLSHYFLFDGERWSDMTVGGVRENIRESVHILTGLSSYQRAMWHLKDMGSMSVIRKWKGKITGGGALFDSLKEEQKKIEREIGACREKLEILDVNSANCEEKAAGLEEFLAENRETQELQAKKRQLLTVKRAQAERGTADYRLFVQEFSDRAYLVFAQPMMEAALEMVKSVSGVRRDIPHMRQASIDFLLKTGRCICGTPIRPGSAEYDCLIEQRNYLPPADIGSLLGEFERTAARWNNRGAGLEEELVSLAKRVDDDFREYEDTCNELAETEQKMDAQIDFAEIRERLGGYRREQQRLSNQKGDLKGRMEAYHRQLGRLELELQAQEAQNEENRKWRGRLALAEQIYRRMSDDFAKKEKQIFLELNERIQENFSRMFNAKDKRIELDSQYRIRMFYRTDTGMREEKNLSEGEKIARNFAFIVTIMEYSRKKKAQQSAQTAGDALPIVLDGPFSKLGDENIGLIAGVLPAAAEQVILFMLEKDWNYTGLDEHVGAVYRIERDAERISATVRKQEG